MTNSISWKLTKPYRKLGDLAKWFVSRSIGWITFHPNSRPRRVLKQKLISLKHSINANPELKKIVTKILEKLPYINSKLINLTNHNHQIRNTLTLNKGKENFFLHIKKEIEERKMNLHKELNNE